MNTCVQKAGIPSENNLLHRMRLLRLDTAALFVVARETLHPQKEPVLINIPDCCTSCFNHLLEEKRNSLRRRRTA